MDTREASELLRATMYMCKCSELMSTWFCILDYDVLDTWFDTNRACLPISLSRMLDPRIIKHETTL